MEGPKGPYGCVGIMRGHHPKATAEQLGRDSWASCSVCGVASVLKRRDFQCQGFSNPRYPLKWLYDNGDY